MEVDDQNIDSLELFHTGNAKLFQGLPKHTCNTASIGTIGWSSIMANVDILKMLFLWRMLILPMTCIYMYKVISLRKCIEIINGGLNVKGPTDKMLTTCSAYGLLKVVENSVIICI